MPLFKFKKPIKLWPIWKWPIWKKLGDALKDIARGELGEKK